MSSQATQTHRVVIGASLLSAAATLPLHLLPVLVLALGKDGILAPGQAGWVGTAYMLGQLSTVMLMPACGARRVPWPVALLAAIAVLLAAWSSSVLPLSGGVLVAWLVVGIMAGVLQYLGNTTAAAAPDRRTAFSIRMAASAVAGAALMAWLQLSRAQLADYRSVCLQFVLAFCVLSTLGLLLYRPGAASGSPAADAARPTSPLGIRGGLIVLFILFVGQQGLGALLMRGASERSLALDQIVWTMCVSKLLGAAAVLLGNPRNARAPGALELLLSGAIVAIGATCIGVAAGTVVYACGLVLWEVALNVLSARYQAFLAYRNPVAAGMWITAGIFLGAATGHALGPNAAEAGHLAGLVLFAVLTALAPWAWAAFVSRAQPFKGVSHAADV